MRRLVSAVALVLIIFGATNNAWAAAPGPRVALVIGNSAYSTTPLKNPENDARLIAETLRSLGFQVIERTNVSQKGMRRLFGDFGDALDDAGPDSVGLFYFSGHGVQVRGENFLIPTDATINRERDVKIEAVSANEILNTLSFADNRLNIVILDACRNNPYVGLFKSPGRGLARMDAPRGTLVAYSTAPGTLAKDGEGLNSPYTAALARAMRSPGVPAEQVFKLVRDSVMDETKGAQVPWEESSLTGADFYFNVNVAVTVETPEATGLSDTAAATQQESLFWNSIKDSDNPAMFDEYLRQFPTGVFAGLARLKSDALRKDAMSDSQSRPPTPSDPDMGEIAEPEEETKTTLVTPTTGVFDGEWKGLLSGRKSGDEDTPMEATVANNRIVIKVDTKSGRWKLKGTFEGEISDSGNFYFWRYTELEWPRTITVEGKMFGDIAEGSVKGWGKFRLQRVSTP